MVFSFVCLLFFLSLCCSLLFVGIYWCKLANEVSVFPAAKVHLDQCAGSHEYKNPTSSPSFWEDAQCDGRGRGRRDGRVPAGKDINAGIRWLLDN